MNTQTQEALKMAIEFMGTLTIDVGIKTWNEKHRKEAIQACKEALEQPEPRMFLDLSNSNGNHPIEQPAFDYNTAFSHGYEAHRVEQKLEQPAYETESWKNNMKEAEKILAKAKFANEQPAQEPAYQVGEIVNPYGSNIKIKQPAQEPVAWISGGGVLTKLKSEAQLWIIKGGTAIPLYSHPAPSWQGLSDDEIREIDDLTLGAEYFEEQATEFARAIEQALKEKNL